MMVKYPAGGEKWLRGAALVCGVAIFAWMSPEDHTSVFAALLGVAAALIIVLTWAQRRYAGQQMTRFTFGALMGALGLLSGAGGALMTVVLMFFKNAWHAHPFWDYPPELLAALLLRTPLWALAGACFGVGAALVWIAARRS